MKIFFLLNPSRSRKQWDFRQAAARAAQRSGDVARFGQVDRTLPRSMDHLLRQAAEEDCSRVVVMGGDGTLNRAINWLSSQKRLSTMDVAVVPAGTCNDFARSIGLVPRKLDAALRIACSGQSRPTDLGRMDDRLFLNNAGFGRRPQPTATRRARPLRTLRSLQGIPLRAEWEKGSIQGTFFLALVCNAPFFSKGLHFSRNVRVNDGFLDVYLVPPMPKWRLLQRLVIGRMGRAVRSREMITLRVQQLALETGTDLWPQVDGEPAAGATRRVHFSIAPGHARIVVPETAKSLSYYV